MSMITPTALALLLVVAAVVLVGVALLVRRRDEGWRIAFGSGARSAALPPAPELHGTRGIVTLGEVFVARFQVVGPRYRRRVSAIEGRHAVLTPLPEDALHGAEALRLTADEILLHFRLDGAGAPADPREPARSGVHPRSRDRETLPARRRA